MRNTALLLSNGLLALALSTPAWAQSVIDVSAAFSDIWAGNCPQAIGSDPCISFNEWSAAITFHPKPRLGIVGEVGGFRGTTEADGFPQEGTAHGYSLLVGPKIRRSGAHTLTPFGQVLMGIVHGTGSEMGFPGGSGTQPGPGTFDLVSSVTDVGIVTGVGIDYTISSRFALRGGCDFRWIHKRQHYESNAPAYDYGFGPEKAKAVSLERAEASGFRFTVGVVWRLR